MLKNGRLIWLLIGQGLLQVQQCERVPGAEARREGLRRSVDAHRHLRGRTPARRPAGGAVAGAVGCWIRLGRAWPLSCGRERKLIFGEEMKYRFFSFFFFFYLDYICFFLF